MHLTIADFATVTKGDLDLSPLRELGEVTLLDCFDPQTDRLPEETEILLCNKTRVDKALMDTLPNLRYIGLFATGYNNIDIAEADRRGIAVCNAGSYSTKSVAQQVFGFLLAHAARVAEYNAFVQDGGWVRSKTFSAFGQPTSELAGKTLGIVGYGSIGQEVAKIARAFSMQVVVYTRTEREDASVTFLSLEELLKQSDYITFHCPLTDQTRGMVGAKELALCKPTAFLVNTARGGVVVEQDLADALNAGRLAGAGVDVLSAEPMRPDCPLLGAKNCLITPHVAWTPYETRQRLMGIVCQNLKSFLAGSPENLVNHPKKEGQ